MGKTARKKPAFQFYTGDWRKDPNLSMCSPATRGIWIDMISLMHEDNQSGVLSGPLAGMASACRCSTEDLLHALYELILTHTANVSAHFPEVFRDFSTDFPRFFRDFSGLFPQDCDAHVTVICRRLKRVADERDKNNKRKELERERKRSGKTSSRQCHDEVTKKSRLRSSASVSSSSSDIKTTAKNTFQRTKPSPTTPKAAVEPPKTIAETIELPPLNDPAYPPMKEALDIARGIDAAQERNEFAFEGKRLKVPMDTWNTWLDSLGIMPGQLATALAILDAEIAVKGKSIRSPVGYASTILMAKSNDGSLHEWMRRAKPKNMDVRQLVRGVL